MIQNEYISIYFSSKAKLIGKTSCYYFYFEPFRTFAKKNALKDITLLFFSRKGLPGDCNPCCKVNSIVYCMCHYMRLPIFRRLKKWSQGVVINLEQKKKWIRENVNCGIWRIYSNWEKYLRVVQVIWRGPIRCQWKSSSWTS